MHSSDTKHKSVDILVDELYDTRNILDETQQLTAVDRIIEILGNISGEVMDLPPARQAVIVRRAGYDNCLGKSSLEVWIPHVASSGGPGQWVTFPDWFHNIQIYREASAREALGAVGTHGLDGIGSSPGYFGPHLQYGLKKGMFGQEAVDSAQELYVASQRKI